MLQQTTNCIKMCVFLSFVEPYRAWQQLQQEYASLSIM